MLALSYDLYQTKSCDKDYIFHDFVPKIRYGYNLLKEGTKGNKLRNIIKEYEKQGQKVVHKNVS